MSCPLTNGLDLPSPRVPVIISSQVTVVPSGVLIRDVGQVESDSPVSQSDSVHLDPTHKLLVLRLWELDAVYHLIYNLNIRHTEEVNERQVGLGVAALLRLEGGWGPFDGRRP